MKHFLVQFGDITNPGGRLFCEIVATLPTWDSSYEGRLILVTADMNLYYGTATAWKKAGASTGTFNNLSIAVFDGTDGTIKMGSSAAYIDSGGNLYATKVHNAVWNDIADYIDVDPGTVIEFGKVYTVNFDGKILPSSSYCQQGIIGVASDTYGFGLGLRGEKPVDKLPVCIGGFVLACVDFPYLPGTPLTSSENGYLTVMKDKDKKEYPERLVGIFFRQEKNTDWNGVQVNGRHWVKVV